MENNINLLGPETSQKIIKSSLWSHLKTEAFLLVLEEMLHKASSELLICGFLHGFTRLAFWIWNNTVFQSTVFKSCMHPFSIGATTHLYISQP